MDDFCAAAVQRLLTCPWSVEYRQETGSTNAVVRRWGDEGRAEGQVLLADRQTAGRGRLGRQFHSPEGTGVYLSVLLRPVGGSEECSFLTVRAAVAACRAAEALGVSPGIKWVNDLVLEGRKVCGILVESALTPGSDRLDYAVCGVGFNVFPPENGFPPELEPIAGALLEDFDPTARARLAAAFLNEFYALLTEDRISVLEEYRRRSVLMGRSVISPAGAFSGTATVTGIDDEGGLVLRLADGTARTLRCGEVSVRLHE